MATTSLPKGFTSVQDLLTGEVKMGTMVNVVGVVKHCRAPTATRGTDYKMDAAMFDMSTQEGSDTIDLVIFKPEAEMPEFGAADIVLLREVKVQEWSGNISLLTNRRTTMHVYNASDIPKLPESAASALRLHKGSGRGKAPSEKENEYVTYMHYSIDKYSIPDAASFEAKVTQSVNVKDKFCLLANVRESKFCDIIVQIVKNPYDEGDKLSFWVTDYTKNDAFFNHVWPGSGGGDNGDGDGDPYGYTSKFGPAPSHEAAEPWPGPFGKMSMQMTCWDPHADFMRSAVKQGSWVCLRNVQIKYGKTAQNNIEGVMRQDRDYPNRVNVEILHTNEGPNGRIDQRLVDAIRRKKEYEKTKTQQIRELNGGPSSTAASNIPQPDSKKRKAVNDPQPGKLNSKARRKQERAEQQKARAQAEMREQEALGLNDLIKAEHPEQATSPLSMLLEDVYYEVNINGQLVQLNLPFNNANYRVNARVVDFRPRQLESFAVGRKTSEYDILENDSGDDSVDEDLSPARRGGQGNWVWEWRFALQLEDANPKRSKTAPPDRVWVVVDNLEGQMLTNINAADLRKDQDILEKLRDRLFTLWGNLEEIKSAESAAILHSKHRLDAGLPPPSSDDNNVWTTAAKHPQPQQLSNKPFACCVRQYGVKRATSDPGEMDAGKGKKWERVFGLFGTKICS